MGYRIRYGKKGRVFRKMQDGRRNRILLAGILGGVLLSTAVWSDAWTRELREVFCPETDESRSELFDRYTLGEPVETLVIDLCRNHLAEAGYAE